MTLKQINKILNEIRKKAKTIRCPDYLFKKIIADIDNGYKDYKKRPCKYCEMVTLCQYKIKHPKTEYCPAADLRPPDLVNKIRTT